MTLALVWGLGLFVVEPPRVSMTLPVECPSGENLEPRLAGWLAERDATPFHSHVDVRATSSGGFAVVVEVTVEAQRERRTFEAPSCASALDAAALVITVSVDALTGSIDDSSAVGITEDLVDEPSSR